MTNRHCVVVLDKFIFEGFKNVATDALKADNFEIIPYETIMFEQIYDRFILAER